MTKIGTSSPQSLKHRKLDLRISWVVIDSLNQPNKVEMLRKDVQSECKGTELVTQTRIIFLNFVICDMKSIYQYTHMPVSMLSMINHESII